MFSHKKVDYIWNDDTLTFEKLCSLDVGVTGETLHSYKPLTDDEALTRFVYSFPLSVPCFYLFFSRRAVYGDNVIMIKRNSILNLLFQQVLGPYYIFQAFSLILWFCDNYFYYAAAVLAISTYNIGESVVQTREVSNTRNSSKKHILYIISSTYYH